MNAITKTSTELQAELVVLEAELADCTAQVASINRLSGDVQRLTTQHALGNATATEILAAQKRVDEATTAITRKQHLTQAVEDQRRTIKHTIGKERGDLCESIRSNFADMNARYSIESQKLLALFVGMHQASIKHMGMTGTPLLYQADYKNFNLPALRRDGDSDLFSIGDQVASGDIK